MRNWKANQYPIWNLKESQTKGNEIWWNTWTTELTSSVCCRIISRRSPANAHLKNSPLLSFFLCRILNRQEQENRLLLSRFISSFQLKNRKTENNIKDSFIIQKWWSTVLQHPDFDQSFSYSKLWTGHQMQMGLSFLQLWRLKFPVFLIKKSPTLTLTLWF